MSRSSPYHRPLGAVTDNVELLLPVSHGTLAYLARRAADRDVQVTVAERVVHRSRPAFGKVAIMPRDAREAKYGKPLVVADIPADPDATPIVNVGWGTKHLEELVEEIDEVRHYGKDAFVPEPTDWQAVYGEMQQIRKARRAGRHVFGPSPSWTRR